MCQLRGSSNFISPPQCKYVNFHISKFFIHLDVYLYPIHWPAPSWLVSSIGRALHRYRRGHGFKSRTGLNFFQVLFTTTSFISVLSCEDLLISSCQFIVCELCEDVKDWQLVCLFYSLFLPEWSANKAVICIDAVRLPIQTVKGLVHEAQWKWKNVISLSSR